jgi:hypothetical protein
MKRDMDLVRRILAGVYEADRALGHEAFEMDDYSPAEVFYHIELLTAKGYLDSNVKPTFPAGSFYGTVTGLTWDGQDFYEAMADDRVWRKTKEVVTKAVGTTTLNVIRQTLELVAMGLIRQAL